MTDTTDLTLYHAPNSRSSGVLTLLEALDADYRIHLVDFSKGDHKHEGFLALNPMGKVPVVKHGSTIVTEQVAIYQYLAEIYPDKKLCPPVGDPDRGAFLRWLSFYGSCFEPAIIDRSQQRTNDNLASSPYGDFDTTFATVVKQLTENEYIAGHQFTSADVLWGSALGWIIRFELVPESSVLTSYVKRITSEPWFASAAAKDEGFARQLEKSKNGQ